MTDSWNVGDKYPGFNYPNKVANFENPVSFANVSGLGSNEGSNYYVDGTNGASTNDGKSWATAIDTIQGAVDLASAGDNIYIAPKLIADATGDPTSYAETIIIPYTKPSMSLIGVSRGLTQGGLPQIKPGGAAHTYALKIRAPGCLIANLGFNGNSAVGAPINGAILLDDDYSTKSAFGTTIIGCHFKNCAGTTITDCRTGGAIDWPAAGNAWQVRIQGNRFYKNACDVCLLGTSNTQPQDVIICNNTFSGPTANVDTNLYLAGGSGMLGVHVDNNIFGPIGTLGSAVVKRLISATGCVGTFSWNTCQTNGLTYGAAGTGGLIPTTMMIAGNYQDNALIART